MIKYLEKYETFLNRVAVLKKQLEDLGLERGTIGSPLGQESVRGTKKSDPTANMAVKLVDKANRINAEIDACIQNMDEVESLIKCLEDEREFFIIWMRYVSCEHDFEVIGNKLSKPLGRRQTKRIHDIAVHKLSDYLRGRRED